MVSSVLGMMGTRWCTTSIVTSVSWSGFFMTSLKGLMTAGGAVMEPTIYFVVG